MNPGTRAYRGYDASLSARGFATGRAIRSSVTGDRSRWNLHPGEQCNNVIGSRMKSFRGSRVAGSCKPRTAFISMVLIYSKPSLESQITAQQLVVTNDCCWMVLSLAAGRPWLRLRLRISFLWTMCYCLLHHYHFQYNHWIEKKQKNKTDGIERVCVWAHIRKMKVRL